ncbi:DNA-methyltransferase [Halocalculus aciditolerans]|uniref:Type II methyltransferase n=1 Tax=Halocalculus aciditolerans TaxID=1383812 RepID=A0A830FQN4_9EURY|nr:site-specific DNA-methyltransferase [Halocalculus aciditolerans]GGL71395.1 hypothetical protein GCM10009039_31830 [Halocalculus aciditolerans]
MDENLSEVDEEVRGVIEIIAQHISHQNNSTSLTDFVDEVGEASSVDDLYDYLLDNPKAAVNLVGDLEEYFDHPAPDLEKLKEGQGEFPADTEPWWNVVEADAAKIHPKDGGSENQENAIDLGKNSVDLIVTSPPYWQKRDYGTEDQLGQEPDPDTYIENLIDALEHWKVFLRPTGSVFLNIGDTYHNKSLQGIPGRFARAAQEAGWTIRNEIQWAKDNGIPSSAQDRLVPRHEPIFHLVQDKDNYFYDLHGYSELYGNGSNPGDVWRISHDRNTGDHLAPFPRDLVRRAITLACPPSICSECNEPRRRDTKRGLTELNTDRPQAERALEIYHNHDELTEDHIRAIQAVGISDVGKAEEFQVGAGANDEDVQRRAKKAKEILGGYFREFTFPEWTTVGWTSCECEDPGWTRGTVFDPFAGSGTTIQVANSLGYNGFGTDLDTSNFQQDQALSTYK